MWVLSSEKTKHVGVVIKLADHLSNLSEFLESFYMKYGSFNPLSENDVLEHLKKKGNTHLSNRLVYKDTHTQTHTLLDGLSESLNHTLK